MNFNNQTVGTTSSAQTATLTNKGSSALSITSIAVTGTNSSDFAETNTCRGSVAAGANCTISVTFTPKASGTRTATVTITDSDPSSPQIVGLTGTGVAATTTASVSPSLLPFGNQTLGSTSLAQTVTLSNAGSGALTITSMAISANYAQTNNCGSTVNTGASCTISVTFTPSSPGAHNGTLTVNDSATNSPQTVSLTGTGVGPAAQLSPTSLSFSNQAVGTTSAAQTVTLSNGGNAPLTISSISAIGDFAETNTCGGSVAAGANCAISATFHPTASGTRSGTLSITDNASGSPQTVSLTGTGTTTTGGDFSLSVAPTSVNPHGGPIGKRYTLPGPLGRVQSGSRAELWRSAAGSHLRDLAEFGHSERIERFDGHHDGDNHGRLHAGS